MRRSIEIDAYLVVKVNVVSDRSTMGSGGGGVSRKGLTGKKRKAAGGPGSGEVPATREPKRGLGVAELEMIRAQLEKADSFYMVPSLSTPVAAPPPPPPLVGPLPGVRHDQCVCPVQCNRSLNHFILMHICVRTCVRCKVINFHCKSFLLYR